MDYSILATEMALPQYVGMTDAEIAASLSAETIRVQRVTIERLQATAYKTGIATALNAVVMDAAKPASLSVRQ